VGHMFSCIQSQKAAWIGLEETGRDSPLSRVKLKCYLTNVCAPEKREAPEKMTQQNAAAEEKVTLMKGETNSTI